MTIAANEGETNCHLHLLRKIFFSTNSPLVDARLSEIKHG